MAKITPTGTDVGFAWTDGNATGKFTFDNPALQTVTVLAGSLPSSAINAEKATVVVKAPVTAAVISDSTRSQDFTIFRLNMLILQDPNNAGNVLTQMRANPVPGTLYLNENTQGTAAMGITIVVNPAGFQTNRFRWQITDSGVTLANVWSPNQGAGLSASTTWDSTRTPLFRTCLVRTWFDEIENGTFDTAPEANATLTAYATVFKVQLDVEKTLLTLKHDRECDLEITVDPESAPVAQYKIEIKRTSSSTWYTLSTNNEMKPWLAKVAGVFHLRGMTKIGGFDYYTNNTQVEARFPSYTEIVGNADVSGWTAAEWTNTLNDCTDNPNQRRERGFWIRLNTMEMEDVYEHYTVLTGPWVGPAETASLDPGTRPPDSVPDPAPNAVGVTYYVALFHTHTPTTYRTVSRGVGPSSADNAFHTNEGVPGVVYDYVESPTGSGEIPAGHPEASSAQRYHSAGTTRRTTPQ